MSDGIMLSIGEDGIARAYDDTYDITIHCESQEEQDEVKRVLQNVPHWIPVTERSPRKRDHKDDMVLVCNENGSIRFNTCINGTWVYGNPIAWMPLPEPYKG